MGFVAWIHRNLLKNNNMTEKEKDEFIDSIVQVKGFSDYKYFKEVFDKNQVYLHHTVSGEGVDGDINWWIKNKNKICTAFIISSDGTINQCFNSKYWAYHLGISQIVFNENKIPYRRLDKGSIGIEIDSWGGLVKHEDKWYPAKEEDVPNLKCKPVDSEQVQIYDKKFRGYYGFQRYTNKQVEAVRQLLKYLNKVYNISLNYNEDMWDVNKKALSGINGVWTHVSVRPDKSDCHPDKGLVTMLKNLV